MGELVRALVWVFYELDNWYDKWGQVRSQSDTSHLVHGLVWRILHGADGLSADGEV